MRVSTMQMTGAMQYNMMSTTSQMNKTLMEMSSGKSVNKPSDDVLAATQILGLEDDTAQLKSYESSISKAESSLAMTETMLTDMNDSLDRMRDLVLAMGGKPLSGSEKKADDVKGDDDKKAEEKAESEGSSKKSVNNADIAAYVKEIEAVLGNLADITNTKSATGEYIFGGTGGGAEVVSLNKETGQYVVGGSDNVREVQVSDSQAVDQGIVAGDLFDRGEDNFFSDLAGFADMATDPDTTQKELSEAIKNALITIDETQASVNQSITEVGASLNKLEMAKDTNSDQQLYNETMKGGLENTDFSKATMDFTMMQNQLQAGQKAFAMVNGTSLFDYI